MRCYCCDHSPTLFFDNKTNRPYCSACWWEIVEVITEQTEEEIDYSDIKDTPDLS